LRVSIDPLPPRGDHTLQSGVLMKRSVDVRPGLGPLRTWFLVALPAFLAIGAPGLSYGGDGEVPVIEQGRESEVLGLFAPHKLEEELTAGWRLENVAIKWGSIDVELLHIESGEIVGFTLEHPQRADDGARRIGSFALVKLRGLDEGALGGGEGVAGPGGGAIAALDMVLKAVERNDAGQFWRATSEKEGVGTKGIAVTGGLALGDADAWYVVPLKLLGDGLLRALFIGAILIFFGFRRGERHQPWIRPALAGVIVAGLLLRLLLSQETTMSAWPYSRIPDMTYRVFYGPLVSWLTQLFGISITLHNAAHWFTFFMAVLGPLAAFVHGRYLLGCDRKALVAAFGLAFLPMHIRFSLSETEFMPSIVVSAIAFALTHVAMSDPKVWARWLATALLLWIVPVMVTLRPLNVLFLPLLAWVIVFMRRESATVGRRLLVGAASVLVGGIVGYLNLSTAFSQQVSEGLAFSTLLRAGTNLVDPWGNTLINPWMTPLVFSLGALFGAVLLWRARGEERVRGIFLVFWLLMFLGFHAAVIPPEVMMMARYHLHLVIPFVLLWSTAGLWLWNRGRKWLVVGAAAVCLSPLIHIGFITDTDFNDMKEYDFVIESAASLPDGCTVLEYVGPPSEEPNMRFRMASHAIKEGAETFRLNVISIGAPIDLSIPDGGAQMDPLRPEVRELLANPPQCLYYFEGLPCTGVKHPDHHQAPACEAMRNSIPLEEHSNVTVDFRPYDQQTVNGVREELDTVTFRLFKVVPGR